MKKILMYNGKHESQFYDVSTDELRKEAFLSLFNLLDSQYFNCYVELKQDLKEPICDFCNNTGLVKIKEREVKCPECEGNIKRNRQHYEYNQKPQKELYDKAKTGDCEAAYKLLTIRRKYEYENWEIYGVL